MQKQIIPSSWHISHNNIIGNDNDVNTRTTQFKLTSVLEETTVLVVWLSSVMEGQQKWFDSAIQEAIVYSIISGRRALEARTRRSLWAPAKALATGMNISLIHMRWHYCSGHHGGSIFWLSLLVFSSLARGAMNKLMTFWTVGDWFSHACAQTGCHKCECSRTQVKVVSAALLIWSCNLTSVHPLALGIA